MKAHTGRADCVSLLRERRVDWDEIERITGDDVRTLKRYYRAFQADHGRSAAEALNALNVSLDHPLDSAGRIRSLDQIKELGSWQPPRPRLTEILPAQDREPGKQTKPAGTARASSMED